MAEIIDSGYAKEIPENDNPIEGHLFLYPAPRYISPEETREDQSRL